MASGDRRQPIPLDPVPFVVHCLRSLPNGEATCLTCPGSSGPSHTV